jgi:hypothetical protein
MVTKLLTLIRLGSFETALAAPILSEVPYQGVLVAKAQSHTGEDLEIVVYPSSMAGDFPLKISRLTLGRRCAYENKGVTADSEGKFRSPFLLRE